MAANNFNTSNQSFRQLFGNDLTYRIPRFQRDYSWDEDDWSELWQDILSVLNGNDPVHYMGYLVFKLSPAKTVDVIDGQQRMTTLSILVLAVLRCIDDLIKENIDPENNKKRLDHLRATYIGYLDPVSLVSKPKLTLNRHLDFFYRERLVSLQKIQARGLKGAERHLRRAHEWFYGKLSGSYAKSKDGSILAKFIDDLSDKLLFTAISVTDELNAYKVFETLNARGVRLSPTDLLKNYLFSVVDREAHPEQEQTLDTLERYWEEIVENLGKEDFSDFLRVQWNSRHDFVREADLFKTISSGIKDRRAVFDLVRCMKQDLEIYLALINPNAYPSWTPDQKKFLKELNLYGIRQLLALLLAAHRSLDASEFTKVLRACGVITLRYSVIAGQANNLLEVTYSSASKRTANGELKNSTEVLQVLRPIYISDETFEQTFSEKQLRTHGRGLHLSKHLLFALERHISGRSLDPEAYSLEHVLPINPAEAWPNIAPDELVESIYRIGNFALLNEAENRAAGNKGFEDKKLIYAKSEFKITQQLISFTTWSSAEIAERQKSMARLATTVWRVPQFD